MSSVSAAVGVAPYVKVTAVAVGAVLTVILLIALLPPICWAEQIGAARNGVGNVYAIVSFDPDVDEPLVI